MSFGGHLICSGVISAHLEQKNNADQKISKKISKNLNKLETNDLGSAHCAGVSIVEIFMGVGPKSHDSMTHPIINPTLFYLNFRSHVFDCKTWHFIHTFTRNQWGHTQKGGGQ